MNEVDFLSEETANLIGEKCVQRGHWFGIHTAKKIISETLASVIATERIRFVQATERLTTCDDVLELAIDSAACRAAFRQIIGRNRPENLLMFSQRRKYQAFLRGINNPTLKDIESAFLHAIGCSPAKQQ